MNDPMNDPANASVVWPKSVVIVESPSANLNSIYIALKRIQNAGKKPPRFLLRLSRDPEEILGAERVIFPGVGHASHIMEELERRGLARVLPQVQSPIMGICMGMQLLFEQLSEGGERAGLGLLPGNIVPLRPALDSLESNQLSVPHMGWNPIEPRQENNFQWLTGTAKISRACYFVHSYYLPPGPLTVASCHYGRVEISAIVRGQGSAAHIWGCQFHPEKSGRFGAEILQNWLQNATRIL